MTLPLPVYEPVVRQICGVDFVFTDYKEPLVQLEGAVKGYMRGTLPNALADGRLPCAFCDPSARRVSHPNLGCNLFDDLSKHARNVHGMSGREYRDAIGLMARTRLTSRRAHLNYHSGFQRGWERNLAALLEASRSGRGRAKHDATLRANGESPEHLNKRGVCRDQIIDAATASARVNNNVLRRQDLNRRRIWDRDIKRWFTNFRTLCREVGATPGTARGTTDVEYLRAFRELAERLGRTPLQTELGAANGTPSHRSYYQRFGPLEETARRCGLPPRMPGTRIITEGDEVDILSQYAVLGSKRRVRLATHHDAGWCDRVYAKYGVVPSRHEPERRKAQAWAAEMAQRLAS